MRRVRSQAICVCVGSISPQLVYDRNGIKVVLHFGKDRPRPDVQTIVASVTSTCSSAVRNFVFQASVPKVLAALSSRPPYQRYLQLCLTDLRTKVMYYFVFQASLPKVLAALSSRPPYQRHVLLVLQAFVPKVGLLATMSTCSMVHRCRR